MDYSPEYKPKQVFTKRGYDYTRKGYDLKVDTARRFNQKCRRLGQAETQIVEMLIEYFIVATGWDDSCKQPPFFEERSQEHAKQAVGWSVKDLMPFLSKKP